MSTAARKARKRARRIALDSGWRRIPVVGEVWSAQPGAALPTSAAFLTDGEPFRHPMKVGTPVEQRAENQPRSVALLPLSRSVRARRRIEARS